MAALSRTLAPSAVPAILRSLATPVLDFLLPQRCPGCGVPASPERLLCERCLARIPRLATPLCARCLVRGGDGSPCSRHDGYAVHAPWQLDERSREIVHALKYGERPSLARALGGELAGALPTAWRRPDLVLAVPLHAARRRERGYNQAEALSVALAGALRSPHATGLLVRVRATSAQAQLGGEARRRNLAGAFAAPDGAVLKGRRVLLVDDVLTTGATLESALGVVRAAGARAAGVALAWAP
ncbi:MAG: ComF family protein [Candidatus Eisenbacteria bacterium]|nr:ComF family protein [Candidatus Eisenbacteria bacterium]